MNVFAAAAISVVLSMIIVVLTFYISYTLEERKREKSLQHLKRNRGDSRES